MTTRRVLLAIGIAGGIAVTFAPYLPRGTDLYVHVLWPWQVMRCLAVGAPPLWLPDLNAGFGSPGIGLYSPLSPLLAGVLGLVLGGCGRGVRAALVLTAAALVVVAPGRDRRRRDLAAMMLLFAPALWIELFARFPVAELLSLPLAWLVLERALGGGWRWPTEGLLLALLWLVHAPTAVMALVLGGVAAVAGGARAGGVEGIDWTRRAGAFAATLAAFGLTIVAAAALTMWHWWPLLAASSDFPMGAALTGGQHHPLRNLIGVADPHLVEINVAMGWAAIGLLVALLVSGGWRTTRGRLAVLAVFLASLPSYPVWRVVEPLAWLQFPWRFLVPATLLAVPAVLEKSGGLPCRRNLAAAALLLPLFGLPSPRLVVDPHLTAATEPADAGARIHAEFAGNPLLIDVREHRPVWWTDMAPTMRLLGGRDAVLLGGLGNLHTKAWKPLRRELEVMSPQDTVLVVRLLADRHWSVTVGGSQAATQRWGSAVAVAVPSGRSAVIIHWQSDWRAAVGLAGAAAVVGGMAVARRRLRVSRAADCL